VAGDRSESQPRRTCHERALGLLAVRQRSRRELEQRLLRAGYPVEEVDDVLERLQGVGLIDDQAFARAVAEHAFGVRKQGRRSVAVALASKGVDPHVASAVIDDMDQDEVERADQLAGARVSRLSGVEPAKAYQRLSGLLMRRGYSPEVAHAAARRALSVDDTD
jgi:regulatory protein